MKAACAYKLLKFLKQGTLPAHQMLLLIIGTLSFLVARAVIAVFMGYIRRHNFLPSPRTASCWGSSSLAGPWRLARRRELR